MVALNFDKQSPQFRRRVSPRLPPVSPTSPRHNKRPASTATAGFTLIEVLVVIAIIGALTAIIIVTASGVRDSAEKARAKVQFAQWAAAIEAFRSEYGHYPQFAQSHKVNGDLQGSGASGEHWFHDILAGRRRDGQPLGPIAASQNRRHIPFYSFAQSEFANVSGNPGLIQDALGNTDIVVLVDRNLDGRIDASDYPTLPSVTTREGVPLGSPSLPPSGLLISIAFYSAGPRATAANPEFVVSW